MILLDTDIVIDLLRGYLPALNWLAGRTGEEIYLPGLVVMELMQGCASKYEMSALQKFISPFPLLWTPAHVADQALSVYAEGRLTHNLGLLDALIGQLAVSMDVPLYTFNQKHFAAVPGLRTVQPYTRGQ